MRLVADTSVIISALMKDSVSRRLMLLPKFELFTPEFVHIEIENHSMKIMKYAGLPEIEFSLLLNSLLSTVMVIPTDEFKEELSRAYGIMKEIDPNDTAFLALALSLDCDGIWTNDSDFEKQNAVKVWKTEHLKRYL